MVKGYLGLTYCMKNESTGVPWGGLDDLCWIFEYLITGPCRRPLSADFSNVKSVTARGTEAIGNFWS